MTKSPRIESLQVKNLRSIGGDAVKLHFPGDGVLVILGENNAGKSNVTRAIDLLFGDQWPGTRQLEEHDFHGRDSDGIAVEIGARVSGLPCPYCSGMVEYLGWSYDPQRHASDGNPVKYSFRCGSCPKTFPNKVLRAGLAAAVIDADRRLDYQLSYSSKFTMLSKLMHRFHHKLLNDPVRRERLATIFKSLTEEFDGVREFEQFKTLLTTTAQDFGQNLPYRLDIDFSAYDPSNFFRSLRVHPSLDGEIRSLDELGTGQSQVLALAFAFAYARSYGQSDGTILVVDEPEANLHPLAQRWLAQKLNELVSPGLQIVVTTHSPYFVSLSRPDALVTVRKDQSGATTVIQRSLEELCAELVRLGSDESRTTPSKVGEFYEAASTTDIVSGLFARRCVFVEGPTEALALPELLKARGLNVLKEGIAVVSCEGIGNIAKWLRLFTTLGVNCYCVFDTDSQKTGVKAADLKVTRLDIATSLGVGSDPAEKVEGPLHVEATHAMFDPDFERAMERMFGSNWASAYSEAIVEVGNSKSLRARYAARMLNTTGWPADASSRFDKLVDALGTSESVSNGATSQEPRNTTGQQAGMPDGMHSIEDAPPF